jgi:serine protease Do
VGIGFALAINEAKTILPQLETTGHVTRGWLGVSLEPRTAELAKAFKLEPGQGALVADVLPNSPAAKAGLKSDDVCAEANRQPVHSVAALRKAIADQKAGEPTLLRIHRKDASRFVAIEMPGKFQG